MLKIFKDAISVVVMPKIDGYCELPKIGALVNRKATLRIGDGNTHPTLLFVQMQTIG